MTKSKKILIGLKTIKTPRQRPKIPQNSLEWVQRHQYILNIFEYIQLIAGIYFISPISDRQLRRPLARARGQYLFRHRSGGSEIRRNLEDLKV